MKNWTTAVGMECANEVVYVYATPDGRYESIRQPLPLAHSPCFIFTFTHLHAIFTFTACKSASTCECVRVPRIDVALIDVAFITSYEIVWKLCLELYLLVCVHVCACVHHEERER